MYIYICVYICIHSPPPNKNTQLSRDLPHMATRVESMLDPLSQRVRAVKQRQMSLGSANSEVRRLRSAMDTWHAQLEQGGKWICVCVWIFMYMYICTTAAIGYRYLANSVWVPLDMNTFLYVYKHTWHAKMQHVGIKYMCICTYVRAAAAIGMWYLIHWFIDSVSARVWIYICIYIALYIHQYM